MPGTVQASENQFTTTMFPTVTEVHNSSKSISSTVLTATRTSGTAGLSTDLIVYIIIAVTGVVALLFVVVLLCMILVYCLTVRDDKRLDCK